MFGQISAVALFASLAAAVHAPVGEPNGNPINAPLNEIVPACTPFTIKWQPTTPNKVSILLLRGPSTNVVPLGAPIAEGIANSGSFSWTPGAELEADTSRYGIQLIDDVTGQFQYSTQFGISKDACKDVKPSVSSKSAHTASTIAVSTSSCNTTSVAEPTKAHTTPHVASTGYPAHNSSIVLPTKSLSVPETLKTSATPIVVPTGTTPSSTPSAPASTGAAGQLRAGLGLAGAIAGMVFML
ncbi:hypothetical protein K469DRAFT_706555 [Zopfia rhizophila CBS 207.26]|uniref:Yeast cell wall synthesis Kre9/Knh1-like N-terminal domain-containing protein n=1 Tax=Zopfia rhizophila CBS 207.26 TaxID=1314779 RepID=A0A6A6E8S7_9PEZI|nr:hypothetical protein K469DRAFT_706555 [Zopfia rhizophila CBS 207.26]